MKGRESEHGWASCWPCLQITLSPNSCVLCCSHMAEFTWRCVCGENTTLWASVCRHPGLLPLPPLQAAGWQLWLKATHRRYQAPNHYWYQTQLLGRNVHFELTWTHTICFWACSHHIIKASRMKRSWYKYETKVITASSWVTVAKKELMPTLLWVAQGLERCDPRGGCLWQAGTWLCSE